MPDGLVEFLNRRLDEEEAVASAATAGPWSARGGQVGGRCRGGRPVTVVKFSWPQETAHIARQDPHETLARVEALRGVVDLHGLVPAHGYGDGTLGCRACDTDEVGHVQPSPWHDDYCPTLRAFGTAYRSHPEYREEWLPLNASPPPPSGPGHTKAPPPRP